MDRGVGSLWITGDQLSLLLIPLLFTVGLQLQLDARTEGEESDRSATRMEDQFVHNVRQRLRNYATPGLRKPKCSFKEAVWL